VGIIWAAIAVPPWFREERALARLESPESKVQDQAIEALAEMGSVKAIPAILEVMGKRVSVPNSTDSFNFTDPLKSIVEKGGFQAVSPLVHELKSSDRISANCVRAAGGPRNRSSNSDPTTFSVASTSRILDSIASGNKPLRGRSRGTVLSSGAGPLQQRRRKSKFRADDILLDRSR